MSIHDAECKEETPMWNLWEKFDAPRNLLNHQCSKERPHKCDMCSSSFKRKEGLWFHDRQVQTAEKNIPCSECEKKLTNIASIKLHMHIHTLEKRYKCNTCERQFTLKNNLTQHLQVKHGDPAERPKVPCNECGKNYKSKQCERAFGRSDYLQSHMYSTHGLEKPFNCANCEYWEWCGNMENHERTHVKEKPFPCPKCPRYFTKVAYKYRWKTPQ